MISPKFSAPILPHGHSGLLATFCLVLVLWIAPGPAVGQETATIRGEVVNAETRRPLANVQITIAGTDRGVLSDDQGSFSLSGLPAGSVTIEAQRIGFTAETRTIELQGDDAVTLQLELSESVITLNEVVVDAITGEAREQRELANTVGRVGAEEIEQTSATSLTEVLTGRAAGLEIQENRGTTGTGSAIRIRGTNSLSLSNEPLIIVDGTRYSNSSQIDGLIQEGGQPSRLNDLSSQDIESIEVLKGPAASGLYGTAAANGVIIITTKRGERGSTRVRTAVEGGLVRNVHPGLANFAAAQRNGSGELEPSGCLLVDSEAGTCEQEEIAEFNILENPSTTPYREGHRQKYALSVGGGGDEASYFVSGDLENEQGVFETSSLKKAALRANLDFPLRDNLDVSLSSGFVSSDLALPSNSWSSFGYLYNALLGRAFFDPEDPSAVYNQYSPEGTTDHLRGNQEIQRYTSSATLNWWPLDWLRGNLTAGTDLVNFHNYYHYPPGVLFQRDGSRRSVRGSERTYNVNASLTSELALTDQISSNSTLGLDYRREYLTSTAASGRGILKGTETLESASSLVRIGEDFREIITLGWFAQQRFAARDRIFLTLGLRGDDNSAFGEQLGLVAYPSAGLSWVVSDEPFFPDSDVVNSLRLRMSYGRSGLRPGFRQALTYYVPSSIQLDGETQNAVTIGGTGNPELKPEKVDEFELGADVGFFDGRASLDLTFFTKQSSDALIARQLPPSLGLSEVRFDNLGQVENQGLEVGLEGRVIETRPVQWDTRVSLSTLRNRIKDLGEDIPTIVFHSDGVQRHAEGFPAGAWWDRPISYADPDGDGVLALEDVEVGESATFLGPSTPTFMGSVSSSIRLFETVTLSGLFEARTGHKQYNRTERRRCLQGMGSPDRGCQGMWDPDASLEQQAAFIGLLKEGTSAGFIEDGDFLRFKELQLTLDAPQRWIDALGTSIESLKLSISGRNLATWTNYTGMNPGGSHQIGEGANFPTGDLLMQPPLRYWVARLSLGI